MSIYRSFYLFLFLVLLTGTPACSPSMDNSPTIQPERTEPVQLKVSILPFLSFAPFFIADTEGYFSEQGLDIEFVRFDHSATAVAALVQGELDIWVGIVGPGIINAMKKADIQAVADKGYMPEDGCTYVTFLARSELLENDELSDRSNLANLVLVRRSKGDLFDFTLDNLLKDAGLILEDVQVVEIPSPVLGEALGNEAVDIAIIGEPWITRIVETGAAASWQPVQELYPDLTFAFIAYGSRLLHDEVDVGERFMIAYLQGVQKYSEGKTERNLEIVSEATGLDPDLLMQACWPPIRKDGQIDTEGIMDFQAWAIEEGYVDSPILEANEIWNPHFVESAGQILDLPPN